MRNSRIFLLLGSMLILSIATTAQDLQDNTRKDLVLAALKHSYPLQNFDAEIKKVKIDKAKAYQTYIPQISINGSYTHLNAPIEMTVPPIELNLPAPFPQLPALTLDPVRLQKQDILKTDISASMILFSGMRVYYGTEALTHQQNATQELSRNEVSKTIAELLATYDRLAVIAQSEKVLQESEVRLAKEAAFAAKALEQGLITPYDQSKIEIARQELEAKRLELQTAKSLTASKLAQLTGKPATDFINISPRLVIWKADSVGETYTTHPQYQALTEAAKAYHAKSNSTYSGYIPTVYAYGKKELLTDDLSALDPEWLVGIGVKWTIFDGLMSHRNTQQARLDEVIAQNNLKNADELLSLNLQKSQEELELANQLIKVAEKKRTTAKKGLDIAMKQYELGLGSITERVAAETDYQSAQLTYIEAIYRQRTATANLLQATGSLNINQIND